MIGRLIEGNETFKMKTSFSQNKYLKKKKERHLFFVRPTEVTLQSLAEHYYLSDPRKIKYPSKFVVCLIFTF